MIRTSVIIPTLNQSKKLSLCLQYLTELNFEPALFEVLVIDNGSTDNTKGVALGFKGRILNLHYHYCAEPGLMAARHLGAEQAQGEILCYLDDDSLVTKDWMTGTEETFQDDGVVIAGGPCIPKYEVVPPDWVEKSWTGCEYGRYHGFLSLVDFGKEKLMIHPGFVFGCNYQIRKNTLFEYGGTCPDYYPEKYRQYQGDGESGLSIKLFNAGLKALYNPKARIDHLIPPSRFTVDYFCWRRVFNGIHESYRKIRQQEGLDGHVKPKIHDESPLNKLKLKIKRPLGRIKRQSIKTVRRLLGDNECEQELQGPTKQAEHSEIADIKMKLEQSFSDGYNWHQEYFRTDPKLKEWVLRENYLGVNGRLPE